MRFLICLLTSILVTLPSPALALELEASRAKNAQPKEIRVDHDIDVDGWRMLDIFLSVLRGTGLHGGFVEVTGCSEPSKGRLHVKRGATIQQAMEAIVAENSGYQWSLRGNLVKLMPQKGAPLLGTVVGEFHTVATDKEMEAVLQEVLRLPEVRRREVSLGVKQRTSGGGLSAIPKHPVSNEPAPVPVQIKLENLPLSDAFSKIMDAYPKGVWIYRESDCKGAKDFVVEVASDY